MFYTQVALSNIPPASLSFHYAVDKSSAFQMSVSGGGGRAGISAADSPLDVILKPASMTLGIKVPSSQGLQVQGHHTHLLLDTKGIQVLPLFHPNYKLLQGPRAVQQHSPFDSGIKENHRCQQAATMGSLTIHPLCGDEQLFCCKSTALLVKIQKSKTSFMDQTSNK